MCNRVKVAFSFLERGSDAIAHSFIHTEGMTTMSRTRRIVPTNQLIVSRLFRLYGPNAWYRG